MILLSLINYRLASLLGSPVDNELLLEGFDHFGFVQLRDGRLIRIDFGESLSNPSPAFTDLGDFGIFGG